jgi:hypothetical protein
MAATASSVRGTSAIYAEHLRQHERFTQADREIEERLQNYARSRPRVRELVSAT